MLKEEYKAPGIVEMTDLDKEARNLKLDFGIGLRWLENLYNWAYCYGLDEGKEARHLGAHIPLLEKTEVRQLIDAADVPLPYPRDEAEESTDYEEYDVLLPAMYGDPKSREFFNTLRQLAIDVIIRAYRSGVHDGREYGKVYREV